MPHSSLPTPVCYMPLSPRTGQGNPSFTSIESLAQYHTHHCVHGRAKNQSPPFLPREAFLVEQMAWSTFGKWWEPNLQAGYLIGCQARKMHWGHSARACNQAGDVLVGWVKRQVGRRWFLRNESMGSAAQRRAPGASQSGFGSPLWHGQRREKGRTPQIKVHLNLDKILSFSVPPLPRLLYGDDNTPYTHFTEWLWKLRELQSNEYNVTLKNCCRSMT